MGGYIAYDKMLNKETDNYKIEIQDLQKQLESLKTENQQIKNSATEEDNKNVYMDAAYGRTTLNGDTTTVILFKNGKCIFSASMEYKIGKYTIEDKKSSLTFEGPENTTITQIYNMIEQNDGSYIKLVDEPNSEGLKRLD